MDAGWTSCSVCERGTGLSTSGGNDLSRLEAILATAVRHRKIERNPVTGYRVPAARYVAAILDTAAQMTALLDGAGEPDEAGRLRREHGGHCSSRCLCEGLRIDEALSLRWRDVWLPDMTSGAARTLRTVEDHGARGQDGERRADRRPAPAA